MTSSEFTAGFALHRPITTERRLQIELVTGQMVSVPGLPDRLREIETLVATADPHTFVVLENADLRVTIARDHVVRMWTEIPLSRPA